MFSKMIKIVEPRRFEEYITCLEQKAGELVIKPQFLNICKADLRYYLGLREQNILALKYPLCLIHEAIGEVVKESEIGNIKKNEKVVLIPNRLPECKRDKECAYVCLDLSLGKNYCPESVFASSNADGFLREYLAYKEDSTVKLTTIENEASYVFLELVSVACAAVRRVDINKFDEVIVWGSGNMAYITSAVIKYCYGKSVTVVGRNETRLKQFQFCDTLSVLQAKKKDLKRNLFFECVGGSNSQEAINQIIIEGAIGAEIVLMGVPTQNPAINTRGILEKGIIMKGTTRSEREDFLTAVKCFENHSFRKEIEKLIIDIIEIRNIYDVQKCFELEENEKKLGKHVMKLNL
ncbi:alcohol dehydrogenase catalytic domain-containing protein [Aminipila sp.]|uniref:alcohol dehydrogenase catalytic domain-containing protein n=1 Tax=Aminipila sp. TaxID=2060095 RepID=UPI0028994559|nr:alcohol dehydrogenase catalytic domain-containing protein [Aminipila sp.]